MNVLHIVHNLEVAGAQTVVANLALHASAGVRPVVGAWKRGGELADELRAGGVPVHVLEPSSLRRVPGFLSELVREHRIDLVHGHMSDGAFWGARLARRERLPFVLTHHSNRLLPLSPDPVRRWLRRRMLVGGARSADRNVACGDAVAASVRAELEVPEARLAVVRNGVPLASEEEARLAAVERSERAASSGGLRVVTVGRLDPVKGHHQLVRAAPAVLERAPGSEFVFVGDGPLREELRALGRELGVDDRLHFEGTRRDVGRFLRAADVCAVTSEYEGLPLAVVEAMGWRLPVVASDVVGNRDLVRPNETGTTYPYGDADLLAEALLAARERPTELDAMAERARELVVREYSVERMAADYASVYEAVRRTRA